MLTASLKTASFSLMAIPSILVASQCDNPTSSWQVDHRTIDGPWQEKDGTESFQTSVTSPETHKRCISVILRNIMSLMASTSYSLFQVMDDRLDMRFFFWEDPVSDH